VKIFLTSVGLFLFAFVVHLIIWRLKLPKRQIRALLLIFGAIFCVWLVASMPRSWRLAEILHVILFYGSMSLCYIITYTAIEADSPTLSLIRFLADARMEGRSKDAVAQFMALRPFVRARLAALARSGLIREESSRYVATGAQPLFFRIVLEFRKLYGPISKGG
jgi:hypothetical protein